MEERRLSLKESSDVLGVSERTLYRWIKSGKLKAYKPGRDYQIPEGAIRELLAESEVYPKDLSPRLPLDERGAISEPRATSAAEGHLAVRSTLEELEEDQLREILAGIIDGRITVEAAVHQLEQAGRRPA